MKIITSDNEEINTRVIIIVVDENTELRIRLNESNELEINKFNFGKGESSIIVRPCSSNEVRII